MVDCSGCDVWSPILADQPVFYTRLFMDLPVPPLLLFDMKKASLNLRKAFSTIKPKQMKTFIPRW